jgi:hypothetical protein
MFQDGTSPTSMLSFWTRDRVRGPQLDIEFAVMKQARDTAYMYGMYDRGTLEVGKKADLNIVNMDTLAIQEPVHICKVFSTPLASAYVFSTPLASASQQHLSVALQNHVHDLPTGAPRWDQKVIGYEYTVLSGEVTFQNGLHTGAHPGALVRNAGNRPGIKTGALPDPPAVRARPGRLGGLSVPWRFPSKNMFCMAVLYGRAGRLTTLFGGSRPGQWSTNAHRISTWGINTAEGSTADSALQVAT